MTKERKVVCEKSVDLATRSVTFAFANGEVLAICLDELTPDVLTRAALHGLSQRIGDTYSAAKGDVEVAISLARPVCEGLKGPEGSWGKERTGSGAQMALYVEAVHRVLSGQMEISLEQVVAKLDSMSDEQLKALKKRPEVKAMVDVIKGERAQKAVAAAGDGLANLF